MSLVSPQIVSCCFDSNGKDNNLCQIASEITIL